MLARTNMGLAAPEMAYRAVGCVEEKTGAYTDMAGGAGGLHTPPDTVHLGPQVQASALVAPGGVVCPGTAQGVQVLLPGVR